MKQEKKDKLDALLTKIINQNLDIVMSDRFSRYSKYIIQQRALPDVRDGLKPVQRRILYSMNDLGLQNNKNYKKSARVVGDVIGKYHPHGDSSIYEAMVRMAQDWKMNYPLVEMHGNVGSIDDDPAAAMRYTEAKLSKISDLVIGDLKKNTVKFAPNFDDSEKEPTVFPTLIPTLLLNGADGIASGFATKMPPHNLNEILDAAIAKIKNPDLEWRKLMKYVKGPDFPTGGIIYGTDGIAEAFEVGRGRVTLASKYEIKEDKKNKYIEITEIPFGVIKSKLVRDIDLIIASESIGGLLEIKDQSDRNGISILITLDKNANAESIISYLLQKTELQIYYNYNNVAIQNNRPRTLSLNNLLTAYINHLKDVKRKTLIFDLEKLKLRLEIVIGFLKVAEITDEVIKVIRESENSKQGVIDNLISHFNFTLNQATAIAELRLYKLSKTDKFAFLEEKSNLEKEIKQIEILLNDENEFNLYLINLLTEIKKIYGKPRKTQIVENKIDLSYSETDLIQEEEKYLSISRDGYLKSFSTKVYDTNVWENYGLKEEDKIVFFEKVNTTHQLLIFTNLGNYAIVPIYKINESKWKELGNHLSEFVDLKTGEFIINAYDIDTFDKNNYIALFSKQAQGKRVSLKDFEITRFSKTYTALKLANDDELIAAEMTKGDGDVLLVTEKGFVSFYTENDVQIYGTKSNGTKSCYLSTGDELKFAKLIDFKNDLLVLANEYIAKLETKNIVKTNKKNLGKKIPLLEDKKANKITEISVLSENNFVLYRDTEENLHELLIDLSKLSSSFTKLPISKMSWSQIKPNKSVVKISFENELKETKYTIETKKETNLVAEAEKNILDLDVDSLLNKLKIK
ncbi:DNA topoisomerase IV subunit A [Mycoplasmopsis gallinarum]